MNPIPFLNPYQMAQIRRSAFCVNLLDYYTNMTIFTLKDNGKIQEYMLSPVVSYTSTGSVPTLESINDLWAQVNILYKMREDTEYRIYWFQTALQYVFSKAYFPPPMALSYINMVQECRISIYGGYDTICIATEKAEPFIRNGYLDPDVRKTKHTHKGYESSYMIHYEEDFSVYKEPVANDCLCTG
jgi:hypothetical protein